MCAADALEVVDIFVSGDLRDELMLLLPRALGAKGVKARNVLAQPGGHFRVLQCIIPSKLIFASSQTSACTAVIMPQRSSIDTLMAKGSCLAFLVTCGQVKPGVALCNPFEHTLRYPACRGVRTFTA